MSDGLAEPHALAIINNHVSLSMLLADLDIRGIRSTNTKVICLRKVRLPRNEFADVLQYPDAQSGVASRWQSMRFYRSAARTLRSWMSDTRLRHAYIVNGNNLLTNHLLQMAASSQFDVSVVAEGLLNFADVEVEQHGAWRGSVRSVAAPMMRLRYTLSGWAPFWRVRARRNARRVVRQRRTSGTPRSRRRSPVAELRIGPGTSSAKFCAHCAHRATSAHEAPGLQSLCRGLCRMDPPAGIRRALREAPSEEFGSHARSTSSRTRGDRRWAGP